MKYIIYQDDEQKGPYSYHEIISYLNANKLTPSTMARMEDSDQWMEVSAVIAKRQESQARPQARPQAIASKEIKIKPFEAPFIVTLHYLLAGICFLGSALCLIGVAGGNRSEGAVALNLLIIFLSSGIALIVAGYIISCLAECAFRLRNIEFNTAKSAEIN